MKKYPMETVVGIFVVIGLICVGYMTVKLGKISLFGERRLTRLKPDSRRSPDSGSAARSKSTASR